MRTLLRSIVALVLAVATLELCARIHDDVTRGVPLWALHYTAPALYAYDSSGVHGIPNAHDGKFRMNSFGFRGPEIDPNRETIICFGASETFGPNESADREFPRQLEADLNAGGSQRYQVVNAGIPGMRLEDLHLARILRITKPTYAIIYPTTGWVAWTNSQWNALHPTPRLEGSAARYLGSPADPRKSVDGHPPGITARGSNATPASGGSGKRHRVEGSADIACA